MCKNAYSNQKFNSQHYYRGWVISKCLAWTLVTFEDVLCSLDTPQRGRAVHKVYHCVTLQQGLAWEKHILKHTVWERAWTKHRADPQPCGVLHGLGRRWRHTHDLRLCGSQHGDGSVHVVVSLSRTPQRQTGRHVQIGAHVSSCKNTHTFPDVRASLMG